MHVNKGGASEERDGGKGTEHTQVVNFDELICDGSRLTQTPSDRIDEAASGIKALYTTEMSLD